MKPVPIRSQAALPQAPVSVAYAEPHAVGVLIRVKVQPRATRTAVEGPLGNELKIRIAAPPVDDAANAALLRFLAECLDCPRGHVQLVRGQKSRNKILVIAGATVAAVAAALTPK
jgi:hypothetical protein